MVVVAMLAVTVVPVDEINAPPTPEVTISFDANGGVGAPESHIEYATVGLGQYGSVWVIDYCYIPEEVPTRPGYVFIGWSVEWYHTLVQPGERPYLEWDMSEYETPPSEVTFVAQWEQAYPELTFISDPSDSSIVFIGTGS